MTIKLFALVLLAALTVLSAGCAAREASGASNEELPESQGDMAAACVPRGTTPEKVAAIHLLIDILRLEAAGDGLDCFHWINEVGLLDVAEWHAIAREVWSDAAPELDNPDGRDD